MKHPALVLLFAALCSPLFAQRTRSLESLAAIMEGSYTTVEQAKADIIAGKIQVHDYMADNACPAN